jgi:hypothetical protein
MRSIEDVVCEDCGQILPEFFMVQDWVWRLIGNGEEFLCVSCLDKRARARLQRSLSIKDFKKKSQVNQLLFFGYRLAVRSLMKEIGEENWHSETKEQLQDGESAHDMACLAYSLCGEQEYLAMLERHGIQIKEE